MGVALPIWAVDACQGDLFSTGLWFGHFAQAALADHEPPCFIELPARPDQAPLALAMKVTRGDTAPHCRLLASMSNYYSCGFGPIAQAPPAETALRDLAERLAVAARGFDGVLLGPLDREASFAQICRDALEQRAGFRTCWNLAYRNWFATTESLSYAQYLERVPSSFPRTSEKRRQAFLRKGAGSITITSTERDLPSELEAYLSVYDASWKIEEAYPRFVPGLIQLAARQGWLRLGVARVGGEPAAAQLWFVVDGRALIYKVAYAERFAKLSIGSILTAAMIDHVISQDRVRELDFLSGDDPYKAKWMFARRDRHTLMGFNPRRWRGLLAWWRESISQRRGRESPESPPSPRADL